MPLGLLKNETMTGVDLHEASQYADELLEMGNTASLDHIEGVSGNVTISYKSARAIAIHLKNALTTIATLKAELRQAKQKEAAALQRLGESRCCRNGSFGRCYIPVWAEPFVCSVRPKNSFSYIQRARPHWASTTMHHTLSFTRGCQADIPTSWASYIDLRPNRKEGSG